METLIPAFLLIHGCPRPYVHTGSIKRGEIKIAHIKSTQSHNHVLQLVLFESILPNGSMIRYFLKLT